MGEGVWINANTGSPLESRVLDRTRVAQPVRQKRGGEEPEIQPQTLVRVLILLA